MINQFILYFRCPAAPACLLIPRLFVSFRLCLSPPFSHHPFFHPHHFSLPIPFSVPTLFVPDNFLLLNDCPSPPFFCSYPFWGTEDTWGRNWGQKFLGKDMKRNKCMSGLNTCSCIQLIRFWYDWIWERMSTRSIIQGIFWLLGSDKIWYGRGCQPDVLSKVLFGYKILIKLNMCEAVNQKYFPRQLHRFVCFDMA